MYKYFVPDEPEEVQQAPSVYSQGYCPLICMMSMVSLYCIYFLYPSESEQERLKSLTYN